MKQIKFILLLCLFVIGCEPCYDHSQYCVDNNKRENKSVRHYKDTLIFTRNGETNSVVVVADFIDDENHIQFLQTYSKITKYFENKNKAYEYFEKICRDRQFENAYYDEFRNDKARVSFVYKNECNVVLFKSSLHKYEIIPSER